jgi:hypothetical protein
MADVKRWSCKLLLRRIGANDYEDAGFLNTTRVPQPGEAFDVRVSQGETRPRRGHLRSVDLKTVRTRVVHVDASPPGQVGEFTIRLEETEK